MQALNAQAKGLTSVLTDVALLERGRVHTARPTEGASPHEFSTGESLR